DRLDAGAVLRDHVLDPELGEGIDHPGNARLVEAAQVEPADDRVNAGYARDAHRVAADADDAAVRARRDHHQAAVAHVGDQRLLADERVLDQLAVFLHPEVRRDGLPRLGRVHLARQPHALDDRPGLRDRLDGDLVPLDLVAREPAAIYPALAPLLPAGAEVIDAAVEGQLALETPPPGVQETGQSAPVVPVTVGEGDRVDGRRVERQLAEVVVQCLRGEAKVEGDGEALVAPRGLHEVRQPVLGAQVRHLAGHERAVAARYRAVLAKIVDVVVDHGRDADPVDGTARHGGYPSRSRAMAWLSISVGHGRRMSESRRAPRVRTP